MTQLAGFPWAGASTLADRSASGDASLFLRGCWQRHGFNKPGRANAPEVQRTAGPDSILFGTYSELGLFEKKGSRRLAEDRQSCIPGSLVILVLTNGEKPCIINAC